MIPFYRHFSRPEDFVSHSTCYACLMAPPEHSLPCGHVICTPCLRGLGKPRGKNVVELSACPIHGDTWPLQFSFSVALKPAGAGVRVLSLDG